MRFRRQAVQRLIRKLALGAAASQNGLVSGLPCGVGYFGLSAINTRSRMQVEAAWRNARASARRCHGPSARSQFGTCTFGMRFARAAGPQPLR